MKKTVERVTSCRWPTEFGEFQLIAYQDSIDDKLHFALVKGQIPANEPILVRVHIHNTLCDLTASVRDECGWPVRDALRRVAEEDSGVVVILHQQEQPGTIVNRIRHCCRQDQGEDLPAQPPTHELRTYGLGAQILSDLGIQKMRVLSAPKKMHALSGFGLEVVDYINNDRTNT